MSTYVIGDLQGCAAELEDLLAAIDYRPGSDRLLFLGDLVNRGPESLRALRTVKALGAESVLGNHDLHLLAQAEGCGGPAREKDTLAPVLAAPDREELLEWLRRRPLALLEDGHLLVHAGLPPQWDAATAIACAREVEALLASDDYRELLAGMYGDSPPRWDAALQGPARWRFIINCLTRLRYCGPDGSLALAEKGPPGSQAEGLLPWYEAPGRRSGGEDILFGHWSTLRLAPEAQRRHRVYPLDTGCVWGGSLTAMALADKRTYSVPSRRASSTKL